MKKYKNDFNKDNFDNEIAKQGYYILGKYNLEVIKLLRKFDIKYKLMEKE